jgi:hypothetical protein
MTTSHCNVLLAGALFLSGCSEGISEKFSDEELICNRSPGFIVTAAQTSDEQIKLAEVCIHKWAYRLGRAPGSSTEIAKAAIAACREPIDRVLELKIEDGNRTKEPFTDDLWQLFVKRFDDHALYRVTQGRAGNCSIRGLEQE